MPSPPFMRNSIPPPVADESPEAETKKNQNSIDRQIKHGCASLRRNPPPRDISRHKWVYPPKVKVHAQTDGTGARYHGAVKERVIAKTRLLPRGTMGPNGASTSWKRQSAWGVKAQKAARVETIEVKRE
jgi:hypothetical protein